MVDINKIKSKVSKTLTDSVESIFTDIESAITLSNNLNKEVESLKQNIDQLSKEKVELESYKSILTDIENSRIALKNEEQEHKNKVLNAVNNYITIQNNIELENMKLNELKQLTRNKSVIENELSAINIVLKNSIQEVKDTQNKLKLLSDEHETKIREYNTEINNKKSELNKIIVELQDKQGQIVPKIEALNAREKRLEQKERDLSVIEQRYKKLFKEAGRNFRV